MIHRNGPTALVLMALACLALGAAGTVRAATAPHYAITDLGTLGGKSRASAINNLGQVVGSSETAPGISHAFLYRDGSMHDLGFLGEINHSGVSAAQDINNSGQVVGSSYTAAGELHAVHWDQGQLRDLTLLSGAFLGGVLSNVSGINDKGQMAGRAGQSKAAPQAGHAVLLDQGKLIDLGTLGGEKSGADGLSNLGQVVGWADLAGDKINHAFFWSQNKLLDLGTLGGDTSEAYALNDLGQAVGYADTATGDEHACLWNPDRRIDLGTLGGSFSEALHINNRGQVVGDADNTTGQNRPVLWQGDKIQDLNDLLPAGSGWVLNTAFGINDAGQIVGSGTHNGQERAYLLTPSS